MDITATISQLEAKKAELEAQNEKNKAEIKDINLKIRRLDTVLKHAKNVLDEVGTAEPTSDAQG
jgi:cell division protein FtsB